MKAAPLTTCIGHGIKLILYVNLPISQFQLLVFLILLLAVWHVTNIWFTILGVRNLAFYKIGFVSLNPLTLGSQGQSHLYSSSINKRNIWTSYCQIETLIRMSTLNFASSRPVNKEIAHKVLKLSTRQLHISFSIFLYSAIVIIRQNVQYTENCKRKLTYIALINFSANFFWKFS